MNEPVIEPATIEDLPQLVELLIDLFSHESDFRLDPEKHSRGLQLILEQPNRGRIFVLKNHDRIVGMLNLLFTISTAEGGFVLLLEDLVVHRDFRRNGNGSRLLQYAIDFAKQKSFKRITLLTDRMTEEAEQRFFKKHHFKESNMIPMRLVFETES